MRVCHSKGFDARHATFARRGAVFLAIALVCAIAFGNTAQAADEDPTPPTADSPLMSEIVRARLKSLEDAKDLTDDIRAQAKEHYQQALQELKRTSALQTQETVFANMASAVESQLVEVRAALAKKTPAAETDPLDGESLADLEKQLVQRSNALDVANDAMEVLEDEPERRRTRRAEIPKLRDAARKQLDAIEAQLKLPAVESDSAPLRLATRTLDQAKQQRIEQELLGWDEELAAYEGATPLLPLERDLAARRVAETTTSTDYLRTIVHRRREQHAKEAAESARRDLARTLPALRPLAARNQTLADEGRQAVQRTEEILTQLEQRKEEVAQLAHQADRTREKIDKVGLSDAMGLLLRRQRVALPDVDRFRQDRRKWEAQIRSTQVRLIDFSDERGSLAVVDRHVESTVSALSDIPKGTSHADLKRAVRDLLERRKEYLDGLLRNENRYFDALVELHTVEQQLIDEVGNYTAYIDERVLWIRSTDILGSSDLPHLYRWLAWIADAEHWSEVGARLGSDARRFPLLTGLAVAFFTFLFWCRRKLPQRIAALSDRAARKDCTSFLVTVEVVFETFVLASVWPALLAFLGWRLQSGDASNFAWSVGAGLWSTARFILPFTVFRQLCLPRGLADEHFDWPQNACRFLNWHLSWFILVSAPLIFITATIQTRTTDTWQGSSGRSCVMILLIAIAALNHMLLRRRSPMMQSVAETNPDGWTYRLRHGWYALGVIAPAFLALLAASGFYYTAFQLGVCLIRTGWVVLIVFIFGALLLRWLRMSQRKLAQRQADRNRDDTMPVAVAGPAGPIARRQSSVDLDSISQQSRRLVKAISITAAAVGVWLVWRDVVPALGIFDRLILWHTTRAGLTEAITLTHLLWALIALGLTVLSVRNLPGLLELVILQRLPIDASVRYATVTILRYLLTVVGIVVACRLVGIHWSEVQWLVAAASVGLGFGLQEILANFVSGLILLTERPIRVGDIITVDGVTGVVSTIRMRATVVTNWDRQEFIIPNKDLITGRVLNWTLSNTVNRIVVNVRVPRDTDAELVRELLLKVAHDHPDILDNPAPLANLEEFESGHLLFVLRCYLPDLKNRLGTKHALHAAIQRALHDNSIEIAVPNRDIVIHTTGAAGDP